MLYLYDTGTRTISCLLCTVRWGGTNNLYFSLCAQAETLTNLTETLAEVHSVRETSAETVHSVRNSRFRCRSDNSVRLSHKSAFADRILITAVYTTAVADNLTDCWREYGEMIYRENSLKFKILKQITLQSSFFN